MRQVETFNVNDPEFLRLFEMSFPPEEKIPPMNLRRTFGKGGHLTYYYDEGIFIGFTYCFVCLDTVFLVYIATRPELRNRGYGKEILEAVEDRYNKMNLFLVVEAVEGEGQQREIRSRRRNFYRRNGWRDTGIRLLSDGCYFDSMYYGSSVDADIMDATIRHYENIHNGRY
ncbi:MAG: GNAT family N-acetyltransferase [archaeon]|nr:GNAT family N-acetyltransferase [archaeon]